MRAQCKGPPQNATSCAQCNTHVCSPLLCAQCTHNRSSRPRAPARLCVLIASCNTHLCSLPLHCAPCCCMNPLTACDRRWACLQVARSVASCSSRWRPCMLNCAASVCTMHLPAPAVTQAHEVPESCTLSCVIVKAYSWRRSLVCAPVPLCVLVARHMCAHCYRCVCTVTSASHTQALGLPEKLHAQPRHRQGLHSAHTNLMLTATHTACAPCYCLVPLHVSGFGTT